MYRGDLNTVLISIQMLKSVRSSDRVKSWDAIQILDLSVTVF